MTDQPDLLIELLNRPYTLQKVPFGGIIPARNVLVLAPHQDDEAIGCGGTILRYLEQGARVTILFLTDGRFGGQKGGSAQRREEAEAAWKGISHVTLEFWDYQDSKLCGQDLAGRLNQVVNETGADIIFTPWIIDRHPDHRWAGIALARALKMMPDFKGTLAFYEVLYPLYANNTVNITRQFSQKMEILEAYQSQIKFLNIKETTKNLNYFRGQSVQLRSIQAAEAFFAAHKELYLAVVESLFPREFKGTDNQ